MLAEQERLLTNDTPGVRPDSVARPGFLARARGVVLVLPLLLLVGSSFFFAQTDPDYWWHVRTGQYIWETHSLPRTDIYAFTASPARWITHEWLTELIFYGLASRFGYVANVALFATLGGGIVLLVYAACRQRGLERGIAVSLACLAGAMLVPQANVRPQDITILFLAICTLLITCYRGGQPRVLWALPPLFALWVNLHGGYVIGLLLLGLTIVGEVGATLWQQRSVLAVLALHRTLFITCVLAGLATLLNPNGLAAYLYPLSYAGTRNASLQYVAEWQSPNFHQLLFLPFALSLLLLLALGGVRRVTTLTETLWIVTFTYLGLQSVRHIPLYAVVTLPVLGAQLSTALASLPALPNRIRRWCRPAAFGLWLLLVLAPFVVLASLATNPGTLAARQFSREPNPAGYPAGAVDYLLAHTSPQDRIFNEYRWAGYLIDRTYPERQVFISAQGTDPYGDAIFTQYYAAVQARPGWQQTLDDYQIHLVLIDVNSPLAAALADDPAWQHVYSDDTARLFQRRAPAGQSVP
jgi:hypothetical protein